MVQKKAVEIAKSACEWTLRITESSKFPFDKQGFVIFSLYICILRYNRTIGAVRVLSHPPPSKLGIISKYSKSKGTKGKA